MFVRLSASEGSCDQAWLSMRTCLAAELGHRACCKRFEPKRFLHRGSHDVELANLRRALQHLDRLRVVGDFKLRSTKVGASDGWHTIESNGMLSDAKTRAHRIGRHHAHLAVLARLEPLDASLKHGGRVGTALVVHQLLLCNKSAMVG